MPMTAEGHVCEMVPLCPPRLSLALLLTPLTRLQNLPRELRHSLSITDRTHAELFSEHD